MINRKLSRNYAQALFDNALNSSLKEDILAQLQIINNSINECSDIKALLYSPLIPYINKIKSIDAAGNIFKIDPITQRFLLLLAKNSRLPILPDIIEVYCNLLDKYNNIKRVAVLYANELNTDIINNIKAWLEKKLNTNVELAFIQDKSIIGGIIIKYDNIIEDYSVRNSLEKVRKSLKNVPLHKSISL